MAHDRILVVIGTRPEAIKLAPLIQTLSACPEWQVEVCVTSQHRELLRPVLDFFRIRPDHDLDLMTAGQTPLDVTSRVMRGVAHILAGGRFDRVIVQGDTSSALGGGLAAFYQRVGIVHVEAGLRSGNLAQPFPEEGHRRLLDVVADYLFVPTRQAREHLLKEGVPAERVHLTGNTGIDALFQAREELVRQPRPLPIDLAEGLPLILLTAHRRENFGPPLERILHAVRELIRRRPDLRILFPVHPNPQVRQVVGKLLKSMRNVYLAEPLDYPDFVQAMLRADLILTDSGGVQEEAVTLGKRLLVLRETTERPEGIRCGLAELVGTDTPRIVERALACLDRPPTQGSLTIYGDGQACLRIRDVLRQRASLRLAA